MNDLNIIRDVKGGSEELDHEFSCSENDGSDVSTPVQLLAADLNAREGNLQPSLVCPK